MRPAFDLKHAQALTSAQHVIDIGIIGIDVDLQVIIANPLFAHHVIGLAYARQHTQREHIDLHQPQCVDIVFVPLNEIAVFHRAIVNGHGFIEPVFGQDKPADMLRQMAREFYQLF